MTTSKNLEFLSFVGAIQDIQVFFATLLLVFGVLLFETTTTKTSKQTNKKTPKVLYYISLTS